MLCFGGTESRRSLGPWRSMTFAPLQGEMKLYELYVSVFSKKTRIINAGLDKLLHSN
ncbi:MAG: hypothetical protein JWR21_1793 [Herminiimonas sp.]|nr:hypothetical protein [Herminiimonas sp.]